LVPSLGFCIPVYDNSV